MHFPSGSAGFPATTTGLPSIYTSACVTHQDLVAVFVDVTALLVHEVTYDAILVYVVFDDAVVDVVTIGTTGAVF